MADNERPSNTFLGTLIDKIADKVADKVAALLEARATIGEAHIADIVANMTPIEQAHHMALLALADNLDELGIENLTAVDEHGSARKLVVFDPRPGKRPAFIEPSKTSTTNFATMRFVVHFDGAEYGEQLGTMDEVVAQFERLQAAAHQ